MTLTINPRSSWVPPGPAVTGPNRRQPFQRGVVHWEGVNRDRTPADIAGHIRSMHRSWVNSRGYSLGYGFCVVSDSRHPQDGSCWEVRGFDLNMASNPGRIWQGQPRGNANDWTGSVLLIGPTGVRASARAAATARELFGEWHRRAGTQAQRPLAHSQLDSTACCGDAYRADLNAGLFDPSASPTVPPPVTPPPSTSQGVIDMYLIDVRPNPTAPSGVILRVGLDTIHHVTHGVAVDVDRVFGVPAGEVNVQQAVALLADRSVNQPSPFTGPWSNAELDAAWNAARAR